MKPLGLRAILIAMLSVPFLGTGSAIIYHVVVDGTLVKRQSPPIVPAESQSVDVY